jgi:hypothetical protein
VLLGIPVKLLHKLIRQRLAAGVSDDLSKPGDEQHEEQAQVGAQDLIGNCRIRRLIQE